MMYNLYNQEDKTGQKLYKTAYRMIEAAIRLKEDDAKYS